MFFWLWGFWVFNCAPSLEEFKAQRLGEKRVFYINPQSGGRGRFFDMADEVTPSDALIDAADAVLQEGEGIVIGPLTFGLDLKRHGFVKVSEEMTDTGPYVLWTKQR
jgi:hypothetical protein